MYPDTIGLRYRQGTKRDHVQYGDDAVVQNLNGLELSMHIPSGRRNSNRFEVLRYDARPTRSYGDNQVTTYHRPTRYGRSSREGKRRRDARRNQRKHAAVRMLDQQLSRDFDRTLTQANIKKPGPLRASKDTITSPAPYRPLQQPAVSYNTPSETSWSKFGGLDLVGQQPQPPAKTYNRDASKLAGAKNTVLEMPQWNPTVPNFFSDKIERKQYPLYFDLSSLPKPIELPQTASSKQETQIWRLSVIPRPKPQSRLPPPAYPLKHVPEQAVTACKLHRSDRAVRDAATQTDPMAVCQDIQDATMTDAVGDNFAEYFSATPANLWRILSTPPKRNANDRDPYVTSVIACRSSNEQDALSLLSDDALSVNADRRCELDDTQIPFVHANSLTGHANERATFSVMEPGDDSVIYSPTEDNRAVCELPPGLNEIVVDQWTEEGYANAVIAALDLPHLPPSPSPELESKAVSTAASVVYTKTHGDDQPDDDKRYLGEHDLSTPPSPILNPADEDLVDVSSLVDFMHPPNCWCAGCNDPPELLDAKISTNEEEEWLDFLTLKRSRSPSVSSV